jgi:hypothetical protein
MKYIIVADKAKTSAERTMDINRELFRISRPNPDPEDVSVYLLTMITHPSNGKMALGFESTTSIPVSSSVDVTDLRGMLSEDATEVELDGLEGYLYSKIGSKVNFETIIPSAIVILTYDDLDQAGWFPVNTP